VDVFFLEGCPDRMKGVVIHGILKLLVYAGSAKIVRTLVISYVPATHKTNSIPGCIMKSTTTKMREVVLLPW